MLRVAALVTLCAGVAFAQHTADTCTIGNKWVKDHIAYECYTAPEVAKGVRPIGCVPADHTLDDIVDNGATYKSVGDNGGFVFKCFLADDGMYWETAQCIAADGHVFSSGETYKDNEHRTWACEKTSDGLSLSYEQPPGCTYEGKFIPEGETVVVPLEDAPEESIQEGYTFRCVRNNGVYKMNMIGCALNNGVMIPTNRIGDYNDKTVKCDLKDGKLYIEVIIDDKCTFKDKKYELNRWWDDEDDGFRYRCELHQGKAVVMVYGCLLYYPKGAENATKHVVYRNGQIGPLGKPERHDYYTCRSGTGGWSTSMYSEDETYCGEVDGAKRYLNDRWDVGNIEYRCRLNGHVTPSRCIVRDEEDKVVMRINVNQIRKVDEGIAYRCTIEGSKCVLKGLDKEEYDKLFGEHSGSSGSLSGSGGSGAGDSITTKATTPTTATTTMNTTTEGLCEDLDDICEQLAPMCGERGNMSEEKTHNTAHSHHRCRRPHKPRAPKKCKLLAVATKQLVQKMCPATCGHCDDSMSAKERNIGLNRAALHLALLYTHLH